MPAELESLLEEIYQAGLSAVDPEKAVHRYFRREKPGLSKYRKIFLAGFGKAGFPMAKAVEETAGERLAKGMVIVKDGHGGKLAKTEVVEASHPEPDSRGEKGAEALVKMLSESTCPEDLVIFLISGGGSALLPLPAKGISLQDKQDTTRTLLSCGAEIHEINAIRKHISRVKGGQLLRSVNGASVLALILSDVIGDDLSAIASGPTAGDPTTYHDCLDIIDSYQIGEKLPENVVSHLESGAAGGDNAPPETVKPGDLNSEKIENVIIANNRLALEAAAEKASSSGFKPLILSSSLSGDTRELAGFHVSLAREILAGGHPVQPPCCLVSGGESTVKLRGSGEGGRNMEFTLECARLIEDWQDSRVLFASIGTDGTDGPTDAAGARATPEITGRARELGLSTKDYLERNDSYNFFKPLGGLIITGPTRTNVMDLHIVLVEKN